MRKRLVDGLKRMGGSLLFLLVVDISFGRSGQLGSVWTKCQEMTSTLRSLTWAVRCWVVSLTDPRTSDPTRRFAPDTFKLTED